MFSVRGATRSGERNDQNRPVLAVRELDGYRTDEQLLQPDSQGAFAGTNNEGVFGTV